MILVSSSLVRHMKSVNSRKGESINNKLESMIYIIWDIDELRQIKGGLFPFTSNSISLLMSFIFKFILLF